jgi:cysteine desulfurase
MDYAATTPVSPEVFEEMKPYFTEYFGNPSSVYLLGRKSREAVDLARDRVAKALGADAREIFFTGSGTEADNWAIKSIAYTYKEKGNHIITTKIEHHAVLHTCEYLECQGFEVTYLSVDKDGLISLEELENAIKDTTILITIMHANNEIGTIQPLKEIIEIAKKYDVLVHTDAVQTFGKIPLDVKKLDIDLLSISAHKIYGPKGVGALFIKRGTKLHQFIHGGAQEKRLRAGTENTSGIIGFGKAAELIVNELPAEEKRQQELRDYLIDSVLSKIPHSKLNGHREKRLPFNANFSFNFIEGEGLLLSLDLKGIAASSGSACTSGSLDPSHVLMSIGLTHEVAHGSLRLTLGKYTVKEDVDYVIEVLPQIIGRLRDMSPLYGGKETDCPCTQTK